MKSTSYTLTTPNEHKEIEPLLEQLDVGSIDKDVRAEAMLHAGVDRYVGGVGFFRLQKPWRGHAKDSLVVRHINSGGMQVTVCESSAATSTPAADAEAAAAAAAAAAAELEAQRQAQQQKDAPPAPPANDNAEPTPAPASSPTNS